MNVPFWLLRLLPMWEYICPKCQREVPKNSHECPYCGERFPLALRVPPSFLKDPKKLEEYVHKHILPRVSEFERNYLTKFFTEIFSDGFESGDFSAWTGTSGTGWSVVQANPHHGAYSARALSPAGDPTGAYKNVGQDLGNVRAYFKFTVLPSYGQGVSLFGITQSTNPSAEACFFVIYNNAVNFQVEGRYRTDSGWQVESANVTLQTDEWHYGEIHWVRHASAGEFRCYFDGVEVIAVTGLANDDRTADAATIGNWQIYDASGVDVNVDCFVAADAYIGVEEEATLIEVADSLGLSDAILRNKTVLPITDGVGLADAILRNKTLTIADSVGLVDVPLKGWTPQISDSMALSDAVLRNKVLQLLDSIGLADAVLANKQLVITDAVALADLINVIKGLILKTVTDSIGLSDVILRDKVLALIDAISLTDAVSTPSRVLKELDAVGLADGALVNKVLQVTEGISLAEVVEVGVGGAKKTKLFLVLGDLAIQLSGD